MTEKTDKPRLANFMDQRDFVGLVGVVMIGVGCWWIWQPLGLIAPGTILAGVAIFGGKG